MDASPGTGRRQRSNAAVLRAVRSGAATTRREVEAATGLSRSAVAEAVRELVQQGLVSEHVSAAGGRGRPVAVLAPSRREGLVVGLDFGHAHVAAAVADTAGRVLAESSRPVDVDAAAQSALGAAAELVDEVLAGTGQLREAVLGAAAGIPGPLDETTKLVRSPTILADWVDLNPEAELAQRLGIPVVAGNDADMGAVGEGRFGAARGLRDYLYIKASHGIGAGLVLAGKVYRGAGGLAGEIGHTQVAELGGYCRCGNRGCLETVLSVPTIRDRLDELDGAADPVAARIMHEAGRTIGRVAADLCNCLNPAAVIIGGELATYGDAVVAGVREAIDRYAQPATARMVAVRVAELGARAELLGAIATAIELVDTAPTAP